MSTKAKKNPNRKPTGKKGGRPPARRKGISPTMSWVLLGAGIALVVGVVVFLSVRETLDPGGTGVTDEAAWQGLIADAVQRFGRLDVLVNNAGIVIPGTVESTSLEDWRKIQAVNSEGVFLGCKHAIPAMAKSGGGSIVNISSVAALVGTPPFAAYAASKGAVRSLTQTVAVHCAQQKNGVRCSSVHPGGIDTPMVRNLGGPRQSPPQGSGGGMPTLGQPDDIANMVLYLASDESRLVNGAAMVVDGGMTAA